MTSFIAQPCNTPVHFLALEMYVSSHRSAMGVNLLACMIQQLCGHQTWHRAVFVYVCWSRVLVQMDRPSWTGSRFEEHPLECWTAPPPSVHSPAVQNVKELTSHRLAVVITLHKQYVNLVQTPAACFIGCITTVWVIRCDDYGPVQ